MNPEDVLKDRRYLDRNWITGYGVYGDAFKDMEDIFNNPDTLAKFLKENVEKEKAMTVEEEQDDSSDVENNFGQEQTHEWKLRERRYRAWATVNGEGKIVESHQFNFVSEFFQHLEEEYDFYDLMDGFCVEEEKNLWLFEGDVVSVVGGEYHQGYYEFSVVGVVDFRAGSFCLVDFRNVLHSFEHMEFAEKFEVLGHAYGENFKQLQKSYSFEQNRFGGSKRWHR